MLLAHSIEVESVGLEHCVFTTHTEALRYYSRQSAERVAKGGEVRDEQIIPLPLAYG
jgi:hypothetical protein